MMFSNEIREFVRTTFDKYPLLDYEHMVDNIMSLCKCDLNDEENIAARQAVFTIVKAADEAFNSLSVRINREDGMDAEGKDDMHLMCALLILSKVWSTAFSVSRTDVREAIEEFFVATYANRQLDEMEEEE